MSFVNDGFEKYPKVYIGIESILDFRLGALRFLDNDYGMSCMAGDDYRHRDHDTFPVDMLAFYDLVKNPRVDTLVLSPMTNIYHCTREVVNNLAKSRNLIDNKDGITLTVNIYPFYSKERDTAEDLDYYLPPEHLQMFREDFKNLMGNTISLNFISVSPEDLTPTYLGSEYSYVFMYDYNSWLLLHSENLATSPLLKTVVYGPRIYFTKRTVFDIPPDELTDKHITDAFQMTEEFLAPLLNIQLMDAIYYSVLDPHMRGKINTA